MGIDNSKKDHPLFEHIFRIFSKLNRGVRLQQLKLDQLRPIQFPLFRSRLLLLPWEARWAKSKQKNLELHRPSG